MTLAVDMPPKTWSDAWQTLQHPHKRSVIYGATDRRDDHWLVKLNDFVIDNQGIKGKDKARFFHSLKLLFASGVQFTRALEMLGKRTSNLRLARILSTISYDMENQGLSFSKALEKHPRVFSSSEIKMIYSGELTGKIENVLNSIATQLQKNLELQMRVRSALMYPITVILAVILATVVVMIFIVPRLTSLFTEAGAELPIATKVLIGMSNFTQQFWWLLLTFAIAGWFAWQNWVRSENGRLTWDGWMLNLPLISGLASNIQTVRICQNFSTLIQSGIPLNKALLVLAEIMPNKVMGRAINNIEFDIRNGGKLHKAFGAQEILDPVLTEILEVGETTGTVGEVLQKLGDQYEFEVDAQLNNLSKIIEPVIILVVGAAVIFMILAVLTPIFQMQELFGGGAV